MTDLTLLITVILLVSALVFIPMMLISGRWSERDWKSKYVREWFKQHSFCPQCRGMMDWYAEDHTSYYDEWDGREYFRVQWMCENEGTGNRHTYWTFVEWCSKRIYVDEV